VSLSDDLLTWVSFVFVVWKETINDCVTNSFVIGPAVGGYNSPAAAVQTSMPDYASFVYCTLGNAYQKLGDYAKVIENYTQHGRGRARRTRTSATRIIRRGTMPRQSSTTRSTWRLQRRWATGGEGGSYANLGCTHNRLGDFSQAIKYPISQMRAIDRWTLIWRC